MVEDSEADEPPPPLQPSSPDLSKQPVAKRTAAADGLAEPSPSKKRALPAARTKSLPPKPTVNKLPLPAED